MTNSPRSLECLHIMKQHTPAYQHPELATMALTAITVWVLFSLLTATVAGSIVTRKQCMHHCLSQVLRAAQAHEAPHAVPPCCLASVAFGTQTCRMSTNADILPGSPEYPVERPVHHNQILAVHLSATADLHLAHSEQVDFLLLHSTPSLPAIPLYLAHLTFRC